MLFMQMSTENTSRIITVLMKNSLEMLEFYEKIYTSIDDENLKQIFEYYIGQRKEIIKELKNEASK
jgi:rubrerythrin